VVGGDIPIVVPWFVNVECRVQSSMSYFVHRERKPIFASSNVSVASFSIVVYLFRHRQLNSFCSEGSDGLVNGLVPLLYIIGAYAIIMSEIEAKP
jgi:hypothetical protein